MDFNKEAVLDELTDFEKTHNNEENKISENLEKYLMSVAKTGDTVYPWTTIRALLRRKIELVINEFNEKYPANNVPDLPNVKSFDFAEMKKNLLEIIDAFYGSPFTIQRICELLTAPYKHYKRIDKFMRGLEKNVLVVTTVEPKSVNRNEPLSVNHKSLFMTTSTSYQSASSSSSAYVNGVESGSGVQLQSDYCSTSRLSMSLNSSSPAPLQQLDSFTTVFASPPSTPLAVVSDINTYEASLSSSSSSSSSSSESSPQPIHSPPSMSLSDAGVEKILKFNDETKIEEEKENSVQPFNTEAKHGSSPKELLHEDMKEKSNDESGQVIDNKSDERPSDELEKNNVSHSLSEGEMSDSESRDSSGDVMDTGKNEVNSEYDVKTDVSGDVNEKFTSDEVLLVTEHLKESVASTESESETSMEQDNSHFE